MKANKRFKTGFKTHACSNEVKIPIEYRKKFMGYNTDKWITKFKNGKPTTIYRRYLEFKKSRLK